MNKFQKSLFLIIFLSFIFVIIYCSCNLFYNTNRSKEFKTSEQMYANSLTNNKSSEESTLKLVGDIKSRTGRKYAVNLNFQDNFCIQEIKNSETNEIYAFSEDNDDDWQNINFSQELDLHKNYYYTITYASGRIEEKEFCVDSIIAPEDGIQIDIGTPKRNSSGNYTFPEFDIINVFNEDFDSIIIQFTSAISSGDTILLNQHTGVEINSYLSFTYANFPNMTTDQIIEYLRNNLSIKINKSSQLDSVSIKIAISKNVIEENSAQDTIASYFSGTGHYYKYVKSSGITWKNAKAKAEQETYNGRTGYLATITDRAENDFMLTLVSGYGWLGGSCDYNYIFDANGKQLYSNMSSSLWNWYWVTGPEKGQKFWDKSGFNTYSDWRTNEPNNSGGEYYLHVYIGGKWNDFSNNNSSISGYIVEFGGMPGDIEDDTLTSGIIASSETSLDT